MANPAPTINQINAFNATQGTTIDFNIIGGTELVRSNKIYIYDLSDNSLICTHLYVSTESIHELPPNTDGSIVYESGKSSADFVNGKQYYAQIQTFTDIAGTQSGSGLSVSKLFWCLVDPSLTIATIPSSISTTSYNVSATYDANTSVVSNIIQQYQFSLYSATGSLLQSSGVVVGNGEQQGTSTAYDISYNFSGLSVGSSYYVVVDVTTTQGMSISAQSSTFTVSIDTPTLGEATVVNNACDGYISVTSNLSEEHSHSYSVDAGEIMSFTTDSPNDITKLQVNFNPTQEGTPWMASTDDTDPYTFRATPNINHSINSEFDTLVGGTVNWNQLVSQKTSGSYSSSGITYTNDGNGKVSFSGTATANDGYAVNNEAVMMTKDHIYLITGISGGSASTYALRLNVFGALFYNAGLYKPNTTVGTNMQAYVFNGATVNSFVRGNATDLTAFFGNSATADYVYSLEQANAGAGIAWLRKYFPDLFAYSPYNTGTLESVKPTAHVTRGVNQWDEEWEVGNLSSGTPTTDISRIRSKNYSRCIPNTSYYLENSGRPYYLTWFDADKNFISVTSSGGVRVSPSNAYYFKVSLQNSETSPSYSGGWCINISDPSINGKYYQADHHTYPITELELRGIPKLVDGELRFDGDTRKADGSNNVNRKYSIVDLGTLNWTYDSTYNLWNSYGVSSIVAKDFSQGVIPPFLSEKYISVSFNNSAGLPNSMINDTTTPNRIGSNPTYGSLLVNTGSSTISPSGYLVYRKATPTTETADPFTSPQTIYSGGTEEYITTGLVPVGHQSRYADIYPINGTSDVEVYNTGVNIWDEEWELGGLDGNTGEKDANYDRIRSKNYIPITPNTTYYASLPSDVAIVKCFYNSSKSFIGANTTYKGTFTTPSNASYMRFRLQNNYGTTYNHDVSINYPSTDTSYHAYNPNSQTITQQFDGSYVTYTPTTTNDDPYLFKQTGDVRGDRESFELVGGTVNWNQLASALDATHWSSAVSGTTNVQFSNGVASFLGTVQYAGISLVGDYRPPSLKDHKYFFTVTAKAESNADLQARSFGGYGDINLSVTTNWTTASRVFNLPDGDLSLGNRAILLRDKRTSGWDTVYWKNVMLIDLTSFFGNDPNIADAIYAMEQAQAGSGVAFMRKYFPKVFTAEYNTGTLVSVKPTAHVTRGVNQWDEIAELGYINELTGEKGGSTIRLCSKNYIPIIPNTEYYFQHSGVAKLFWYDSNKKFIGSPANWGQSASFTSPNNCHYAMIGFPEAYSTTYKNDYCLNISNPSINGQYFPYESHTYPITELELRGMSKLVDGELRFDGDTRKADGSNNVNREYMLIDLASYNWYLSQSQANLFWTTAPSNAKQKTTNNHYENTISNKFLQTYSLYTSDLKNKEYIIGANAIYIKDTGYSDAASFKASLTGAYIVHELATPTTETADAYEVPQIVNPLGTEEFVDTRSTPIPVGNNTQYFKREVFGGYIDLASGVLTVTWKGINLGDYSFGRSPIAGSSTKYRFYTYAPDSMTTGQPTTVGDILSTFYPAVSNTDTYNGITGIALHQNDHSINIYDPTKDTFTQADFKAAMNGVMACYRLETPLTYQLTPHQLQTLTGQNNLWHDTNGEMTIVYQLPITDLLVKRRDVSDVSGQWLTLYSQPVEQASDMDFTFIDFLNQYGKTYQYALVPLLTQTQSGVEVEVEGGYTVSDEVQSIFDGVYIGDSTGVQRLKAGVAYNNLNTNQQVGVIPTLGNKYPIIVSNGNIQYDTGSVSGLIVPDDFYSDGNLSRLDMSDKRGVINDFLTNKKPKILKDWNGNIWLVVFTDNVDVSFDNNYGMGVATFTSGWTEVGDPTNQEDLQRTGLINVGGD